MPPEQLAECVERIDALVEKIESLPDPLVRADVQEIVQCLLEYHGAAVGRLLHLVQRETGDAHIGQELAQDELVASLLLLHGLHPADLEVRVQQALERVRPFLQSHGGNVELVRVVEGAVHLRLAGSCHGCPSSAATLKSRIEQAIYEAAPDVAAIEVVDDAQPAGAAGGFVALETLSNGQGDARL